MKELVLPQIVAAGIYNAQLVIRNADESRRRETSMFELELPMEAGGISYMDGECAPISENLIICAKPGQVRHTRLPFRCYYVHMVVREGALFEWLSKLPSYVTVSDRSRYERLFREICTYSETELSMDGMMVQSRLLELIYLLCEQTQSELFRGGVGNRETIERVINYIHDNLAADLSLATLAEYASFSPVYFHSCFKRATGRTLREYVEEQRIKKAIQMLVSTDMTLAAVALECGFSSQAYFNHAFKKRMGSSPRAYIREIYGRYKE